MYLHSAAECGNNLDLVKRIGLPKLVEDPQALDEFLHGGFEFVLVSPQFPVFLGTMELAVEAVKQSRRILDEVLANHPDVDSTRVYLTGLSMGGAAAWMVANEYPDMFAAFAPVASYATYGGTPEGALLIDPKRLVDIPIWAFHGEVDSVINVESPARAIEAIKERGGNVRFTVYPRMGHDVSTPTYTNPELYDWFLQQQREPAAIEHWLLHH